MRPILIAALAFTVMVSSAFAAEDAAKKEDIAKPAVAANPYIQEMNTKAKELAPMLTAKEAETLGLVRENFGVIGSVDIARGKVKEAVGMCAKENPDMAAGLNGRFESWDKELGAIIKKQRATMKTYITKEYFKDHKKVQDYLNTVDDAAKHANESFEGKIVTTPEACKNLQSSMDDTEKVITGILSGLEWPGDKPDSDSKEEKTKTE